MLRNINYFKLIKLVFDLHLRKECLKRLTSRPALRPLYFKSTFFCTWKEEAILLNPLYQLHPLHRYLDLDWTITAEEMEPGTWL